jgi:hypothetical protein
LLGACAIGGYVLYEVFSFHRRKKQFDRIDAFEPYKEEGGWLIGNGVALAKSTDGDLQKAVLGLIKERGHGPIKIRIPGMGAAVIFSSPEVQKLSPLPKGFGYDSVKVLFGANLVTLNHEAHKNHRRTLSKGFSLSALYALVPAFHRHSCNLLNALQKESEINAHEWMVKVTFDIIADQAFGFNSSCVKGGTDARMDLAEAVATTLLLTVKPWTRIVTGAKLAKLLYHKTYTLIDRALSQCLRDRQVARTQSASAASTLKTASSKRKSQLAGETDLLDLLLDASEGEGWSLRDMQDEAFIFFLAGHETTALTLTWLLVHLGKDKAGQKKLREEEAATMSMVRSAKKQERTLKNRGFGTEKAQSIIMASNKKKARKNPKGIFGEDDDGDDAKGREEFKPRVKKEQKMELNKRKRGGKSVKSFKSKKKHKRR